MSKMTEEQKNRGVAILSDKVLLIFYQLNLARMIAKQFNISFGKAYRWTSIVSWSLYIAARTWSSGILHADKHANLVEEFQTDINKVGGKDNAPS